MKAVEGPFAHTPADPDAPWHPLTAHATDVATTLEAFLAPLGVPELARPVGVLHDAGKVPPAFQQYLVDSAAGRTRPPGPPHAIHGALLAHELGYDRDVVNAIYGHHQGLLDTEDLRKGLRQRGDPALLPPIRAFLQRAFPDIMSTRGTRSTRAPLDLELHTRLLLSALADVDFLDTERYRRPHVAAARQGPTLPQFIQAFRASIQHLHHDPPDTALNVIRRDIFDTAVHAAHGPTGVYQLTTPTGGGKTRASLAFALEHAAYHQFDRVVIAAPFNSITTQTARVTRDLLGGLPILEHHSAAPAERLPFPFRLAAENWDAAVIVTSFVQLLESLHAAHPGRVRKLHRLARSVIILDEVQAIPVAFTGPVVRMLEQLSETYGITILLCTATPPAVQGHTPFLTGFRHVHPVLAPDQQERHFQGLRRVTFTREVRPITWADLTRRLTREAQTLTVLNTRADALALLDHFLATDAAPFTRHLSTLQCGAHRHDVLQEVKARLQPQEGKDALNVPRPVHLISTQVIEAGVDIDFPFTARALGPLPSLIQTAGRCNREFKHARGTMLIFEPAEGTPLPSDEYRDLTAHTRTLLAQPGVLDTLDQPGVSEAFYATMYQRLQTDAHQILEQRRQQNFATVEKLFQLIDDNRTPVHVNYGECFALLERLPDEPGMSDLRALSGYTVGVNQSFVNRHLGGLLREVRPGVLRWDGEYDKVAGLRAALPVR